MWSFGNNKSTEFIKETIEKRNSGENEGILRDILFALKELNLKRDNKDESWIFKIEGDKGNSREDVFELKMELKDVLKEN